MFLKAYRNLNRFRGEASFATWLHRLAANHCLDMLRRDHRRPTQPLEAASSTTEPGNLITLLEDADLIARVLAQLPPDYRLILTLREAQGLSYEEIAQTLECSLDAVKARLRRAREALTHAAQHFLHLEDV